jgi:hypothetical protein
MSSRLPIYDTIADMELRLAIYAASLPDDEVIP